MQKIMKYQIRFYFQIFHKTIFVYQLFIMTLEKQPYKALSNYFFQEILNFSNLIELKISPIQALNELHSQWHIFKDYFQKKKLRNSLLS